jgi:hypothetical protein
MLMNIFDPIKDLRKVFLILVFMLVFFIALSPPQDADMWWPGEDTYHRYFLIYT